MKTLLLSMLLLPGLALGYSWHPYGPAGIVANNICFGAGAGQTVISTSDGIRVCDVTGTNWDSYSVTGLPVREVIPFGSTSLLLVAGNGSNSDGIYRFDLNTHQFTVLQYTLNPTFIKYCTSNQTYYAGSSNDGLWSSAGGLSWNLVPFFASIPATTMDFYNNCLVLSTGFFFQSIYNSTDNGLNWNHTNGNGNFMTCIAYHPDGRLYGIIPVSNSASLRVSQDAGQNWDICYWSDDGLNTIGFDVIGNIFVGYRNAGFGIARYDPVTSALTYLNDGLPNKFINRIAYNPVMSSITLFCCTDGGVYFSNDYLAGITDSRENDGADVTVFPNPCTSVASVLFSLPDFSGKTLTLGILNSSGVIVSERIYQASDSKRNMISLDMGCYPPGVYYYRLYAGKYDVIKKVVVEK
ncbi:MAG: T9SS type A sorting domain-containing protein [Bacteroidota bacterium]